MKTVLITGVTGFLGSYAAEVCRSAGWRVIGISRSKSASQSPKEKSHIVGDLESVDLEKHVASYNIDYCLHFGGASNVALSMANPYEDFRSTVPSFVRLIEYLRIHQPKCHTVVASSAAVYGNPLELPVKTSAPLRPISPYGTHKLLVESIAESYRRIFGMRFSILRIFSAFGPGLKIQILWDISNKGLDAAQKGKDVIQLFGTGEETRDFIHGHDVARAAVMVAEAQEDQGVWIYNVASGLETTIKSLAQMALGTLKIPVEAHFSGVKRAGDPTRWRADVTPLKNLGFSVSLPMSREVIEAYTSWAASQLALREK